MNNHPQYKSNQQEEFIIITMAEKHSQELNRLISLVPKHLRKYIKQGIFIVPNESLIADYHNKKQYYLQEIRNSKKGSVNSMHKYTSINPISAQDVQNINETLKKPLNQYYGLYLKHLEFKRTEPELFASFAITYNTGHKGLNLHTDDSIYTVNFCLQNSASGNEVVFNEMTTIQALQDYTLIHSGNVPHYTNELTSGERVNIVLWFK